MNFEKGFDGHHHLPTVETYSTIKETTEEVDQLNQGNESELMLERVKSTSG